MHVVIQVVELKEVAVMMMFQRKQNKEKNKIQDLMQLVVLQKKKK